jgi:hypothetical protein
VAPPPPNRIRETTRSKFSLKNNKPHENQLCFYVEKIFAVYFFTKKFARRNTGPSQKSLLKLMKKILSYQPETSLNDGSGCKNSA